MITAFVLNLALISVPELSCGLSVKDSQTADFSAGAQKVQIRILSSSAELVSCERKKEFKDLIFAKIKTGEAGTKQTARPVKLFIFKTSKLGLSKVFEYKLGDVKDEKLDEYKIKRSKKKKGFDIEVGSDPETYHFD